MHEIKTVPHPTQVASNEYAVYLNVQGIQGPERETYYADTSHVGGFNGAAAAAGKDGDFIPWLLSAIVSSARAASRTKTYLGAQYRRPAARRGAKRAFVAVGHTILGIVYALLTGGEPCRDLGANYFDRRDAERLTRRLTRRLEGLGYTVTLAPQVA